MVNSYRRVSLLVAVQVTTYKSWLFAVVLNIPATLFLLSGFASMSVAASNDCIVHYFKCPKSEKILWYIM